MAKYFSFIIFFLATCLLVHAQVSPEQMKKRKGQVKIYYPNIKNQIQSMGEVDHHLKTGLWLSYDEVGVLTKKEYYVNGLRNGFYISYNHYGKTLITGNYLGGKLFGEWKYFSDSGMVLKIFHYDSLGKKIGIQQTFYADGTRETYSVFDKNGNEKRWTYLQKNKLFEITNYSDGKLNGIQLMYSSEKLRYYSGDTLPVLIDHYKNGKLDGEHRKYNGDQLVEAWSYKENMVVGYYRKYDGAGNLSDSMCYDFGKLNGRSYHFRTEKLIRTTDYADGNKTGEEIFYDKNGSGKISSMNYYSNGKLDSAKIYDSPGIYYLIEAKTFPSANPDSVDFYLTRAYYKNGNKKYEYCSRYMNDKLQKEGEYKTWYENGKPNYVLSFVNDTMHGVYKKYNTKGELILTARCYNGRTDSVSAIGYKPVPKKKTSYYYQRDYDYENFVVENIAAGMYFTNWPNNRMLATSSVEIPVTYYKPTDTSTVRECVVDWNASVKPEFPGGENNFYNYIRNNSKYPVTDSKTGNGLVYVTFIVANDGSIHDIEQDIFWEKDTLFAQEAIRLIENMPAWIPGTVKGKAVCMKIHVTINFAVKEEPEYIRLPNSYYYYSPPKKSIKEQIMDSLAIKNAGKDICFYPQVAPAFGIDTSSFKKYIKANLIYPEAEKQKHVEGTVYVSFIVETDGSITNVKTEREVPGVPEFSKEAVRVICTAPKFIPGMKNGKPARVQMVQAVKFKLQ